MEFVLINKRVLIFVIIIFTVMTTYAVWIHISHFQPSEYNEGFDFSDLKPDGGFKFVDIRTNRVKDWNVTLENITITVKTTGKFHKPRITILLETWIKQVTNQTFIITDTEDEKLLKQVDGHLVVTHCGKTHGSWWCHFDDDVYVNTESLLNLLKEFNPHEEQIYLGRRSRPNGIDISYKGKTKTSHFLTGAGYCISKLLSESLDFLVGHEALVKTCQTLRLPDDVTMGIIVTEMLKVPFVESFLFHSPFDRTPPIDYNISFFKKQVMHTIGGNYRPNLTHLDPHYDTSAYQSSYLNIHCILYPNDVICPVT